MKDLLFETENVRLNATIRISVKNNETGERHKTELVRLLSPHPGKSCYDLMVMISPKFAKRRSRECAEVLAHYGETKILHSKSLICSVLSKFNCDEKCTFCRINQVGLHY
jgi:hypothetical protein